MIILSLYTPEGCMHRLIYKIREKNGIDKETFRAILYTSVELNRKHCINGALIASRTHYPQFLEGEHDIVADTFARIEEGKRQVKIFSSPFLLSKKAFFKLGVQSDLNEFKLVSS